MANQFEDYIEIARELVDEYGTLRRMQSKLDEMSRLEWSRPAGMDAAWMRDFKTTAPYDAIRAGVRVLSGLDEDITIDPYAFEENALGDLAAAKLKANKWEQALKWQMDRAARRRAILRQDVTRSALMYDEVVGQVVHLPTQIKTIKRLGGNPNRQEAALRYGDFAILLRNPQSVYTRYSDYMLEAVLYATIKRARDIQSFWNNAELGALIESEEAAEFWVEFDYVDYDRRVVFCYPGESVDVITLGAGVVQDEEKGEMPAHFIKLMDEKWTLDFLPWAAVVGGTQLIKEPDQNRFPLLYGILQSDQWNNTNIIGTLLMSEAIAEAARADIAVSGIDPSAVRTSFGEPGGILEVPTGHTVEPLPQRELDLALREALDRQVGDMSRATIPQVLVTAEMGPNEPFAGFNMRIQQAMASLMPFKFLSERWFEEAYRLMLYWGKDSNAGIRGFGAPGEEFNITPNEIDKDRIYLGVELQTDVPIDRQQRMATAVQASQQLKMPTRDILEMLGETDPDRKIKEWMMEQFDLAHLQGVIQSIQFDASNAIQQLVQQAQQEAIAQVQEQAAQQQDRGGEGLQRGVEAAEGPIFDTAKGGTPTAGANPNATRELQTGRARGTEEEIPV